MKQLIESNREINAAAEGLLEELRQQERTLSDAEQRVRARFGAMLPGVCSIMGGTIVKTGSLLGALHPQQQTANCC